MTQADERRLEREQRRRVWLGVLLPFSLALIVAAAFGIAALSLPRAEQVSLLADSMLTLLVLCPLVVVLFPLLVISIGLVALMSRLTGRGRSPLRRLEAWTAAGEQHIEGWLARIDGHVLEWAVRLAPVRQLLRVFDAPGDGEMEEEAK